MPEEEIVASTESINQSLSLISDKANTPFALSGNIALGVALDEMDKTYVKPLINQVTLFAMWLIRLLRTCTIK